VVLVGFSSPEAGDPAALDVNGSVLAVSVFSDDCVSGSVPVVMIGSCESCGF
jgi:hypothetical protein